MDAPDTSTVLEELRAQTRQLLVVLRDARDLGKGAAAPIEKAASDLEERLARMEPAALILGESGDRRALVDAFLGEAVLGSVQRETQAPLHIRRGASIGYEAKLRGGATERFEESVPERDEAFRRAMTRAARDRDDAVEAARSLREEIEAEERSAKTLATRKRKTGVQRLAALWAWLVAWLYGLFSRGASPAALPEAPRTLDARAREAADRVAAAGAHQATLEAERARYGVERRTSFYAALRAFADDLSRGGELLELTVDVPSADLPAGVVLVSVAAPASLAPLDGCLLVTATEKSARERFAETLDAVGPIATRAVLPAAALPEVGRALEEIRRAAPLAAAQKAASLARACIGRASDEGARAEAVCHSRIHALESQRLADPVEFRAQSMARMEKAIDDAARDVLRAATERVPPRAEKIAAEWREVILACADRKAVETCVQAIRDEAPGRIGALVDETNELVVAQTQRASDTMQLWLLEEIHARYQVARRASAGDGPAPVIADVESSEVGAVDDAPFSGAMDAFEKRRVGLGLGGAAAGAVLGTLVVPVIGTAIGAFLGVFAGLLKGVESLRQDCAAQITACVDESAAQIRAQLESRQESLSAALRASLEESLDSAMQRFARSIARLMEIERKTLESERGKLARLGELRARLEENEAKFAELGARVGATGIEGPPS